MKFKLAAGLIKRFWKPIVGSLIFMILLSLFFIVNIVSGVLNIVSSPLSFFSGSDNSNQIDVIQEYKSLGGQYNLYWPDLAAYDTVRVDGNLDEITKKSIKQTLEKFSYYTEVCTETTNDKGKKEESCSEVRNFHSLETVMKQDNYGEDEIEYARFLSENMLSSNDEQSNIPGGSVVIDPELIENEAFLWPVPNVGTITSGFYRRVNPVTREEEFHKGIDISNGEYGVPIVATADGTIIYWNDDPSSSAGRWIRVQHADGYQSRYLHMNKLAVEEKTDGLPTQVKKGQVIGYIGSTGESTGPHLHFEMRKNGELLNPIILVARSRPK